MRRDENVPEWGSTLEADRDILLQVVLRSVAHLIGTPLHVIGGHAALLGRLDSAGRSAEVISRKTQELASSLQAMNDYAESVRDDAPPVLARRALDETLRWLHTDRVVVREPTACDARVTLGPFRHACASLLLARLREDDASVEVTLSTGDPEVPMAEAGFVQEGRKVVVELAASPAAPSAPLRRHPWLDGGDRDRGVELGLAITSALARRAGGWVELDALGAEPMLRLVWPAV